MEKAGYMQALVSPKYRGSAIKVAAIVGSLLLVINHGEAILNHQMTLRRWLSASFTYLVPYAVNVHGQYSQR